MNLSDEIRKQIEKNKALKLAVGEINNNLSILEGLARKDIMEQVDEAYQRGLEEGKVQSKCGCWGCEYECRTGEHLPCDYCMNNFTNQWIAKSDKIEVGDEVKSLDDSGVEIKGFLPWVVTIADEDDEYCQGIDKEGRVHATKRVRACKTGRHFDIVSILEAMKHD